ncbi:MAG: hypothetical protein NXI09_01350 [Bacteroidetes bacterium]|nr:hypothetical protein [Bacteroidota bacterium]
MKKLTIIILVGMFLFSCTQQEKERKNVKYIGDFSHYEGIDTTKTIVIEQHQIDLDFDNKLDTIILENVKDLIGDPQIFTIVKIKLSSGQSFVINDVAGYTLDVRTKKNFINRINSDKIYIPEFNNTENYMVIWDYQYPSCDAYISVFKIAKGDVNCVYRESFYISEIDDFNKDGKIDFKGETECDENVKESILTVE